VRNKESPSGARQLEGERIDCLRFDPPLRGSGAAHWIGTVKFKSLKLKLVFSARSNLKIEL